VLLEFPSRLRLGSNVFVNRGTIITARAPITIGDDALIGPYVIINSGNHGHALRSVPMNQQDHDSSPIVIERDVWIGAHAAILKGVTLGEGCVVGARAVVTHDVEPYTVVAGVPATPVKERSFTA
jgi:acetyltransferase-like isoleucine patch superfamily enzyme